MADTTDVSAAARALVRHRWRSTRPDRLAEELITRHAELSPGTAAMLRDALGVGVTDRGASADTSLDDLEDLS